MIMSDKNKVEWDKDPVKMTPTEKVLTYIVLREMHPRNGGNWNYYQGCIWYLIGFGNELSKYRHPANELATLRLGLKRVAQATKNPAVINMIPGEREERGWNRLCIYLIEEYERLHATISRG